MRKRERNKNTEIPFFGCFLSISHLRRLFFPSIPPIRLSTTESPKSVISHRQENHKNVLCLRKKLSAFDFD